MKTKPSWQVTLALILIALSALVYYVHFLIFRDPEHIFLYFFGDFAFVFFEVLLVTLVIHRLLHHREERARSQKLNMLNGAFFSELGTELLRMLAGFDAESRRLVEKLALPGDWSEREFLGIREEVENHPAAFAGGGDELEKVKELLAGKKQFLLDLLQNRNLLEEESFTNLVWAVYHLAEELIHRRDLSGLGQADRLHLAGDLKRVYQLLAREWMGYIRHLKKAYPHLFSLAARINPFNPAASVEVK